MDPIAVTALLYKLNIAKLQLYIVYYLYYRVKGFFFFFSRDTGNMFKTPLHTYAILIYLHIFIIYSVFFSSLSFSLSLSSFHSLPSVLSPSLILCVKYF